MMVIDPDHCIDCGACLPECPVDAIADDANSVPEWAEYNAAASALWPNAHTEPEGWEARDRDEPPANPVA